MTWILPWINYKMDFNIIGQLIIICLVLLCFVVVAFGFILRKRAQEKTFHRYEEECFFKDPVSNKKHQFPQSAEKATVFLSVVVPAYFEEERLPPMLDECLEYLEERIKHDVDFSYEVIIVNDGSTDGTGKVALKYVRKYGAGKVRLLNLIENRGKGGAVRMGVESSRGKCILFADADGATRFSDFSKLYDRLKEFMKNQKYEGDIEDFKGIVCGSRAHLEQEAIATRSFFRTILMHGFHLLVYVFTVRTVRDTQCGFKLFTRAASQICFKNLHIQRWAFDVELLYIAEARKIPIAEEAVKWTEIEGSKVTPIWSWLQMGRDLIIIWYHYKIGLWKIET